MATKKYIMLLAAGGMITVGMSSCEYKELDEGCELNNITLDFTWEKVDSIPKAMRVAFYPADAAAQAYLTKGYTFFDLPKSYWPATIQLPAGIYHVTGWNNDTEHVITDKYGSQRTLYATSPAYAPKGTFDTPSVLDSLYNGQRVLDYPDYMVHANEVDFEVFRGQEQKLIMAPDSMTVTIDYIIHGIGGLSWVKQARGAINNVAGKRFIAYENRTEDNVAVMFDCNYNTEDSIVYGRFHVFGIEPTELQKMSHKMVLFFWMNEGKVFLPIDVTKALEAYRKDDKKIIINIPSLGIDLRDYISSKNTFDIDLDEWDDVNIDVGF